MHQLDLDKDRSVFARLIADGLEQFLSASPCPLTLPVTRIDIKFDLTTMDQPCVWVYLDTEPQGAPDSGSSAQWKLMEKWCESWAAACHSACDDEPVKVHSGGQTTTVASEDELKRVVGSYFVGFVIGLRDFGTFNELPCADICYLGVSAVSGGFAWPAWEDRGPANML